MNLAIDITDQVAKESSDSTASTHPLHDTDTNVTSGGAHSKAHVNDHKAAPVRHTTSHIYNFSAHTSPRAPSSLRTSASPRARRSSRPGLRS